MDSTGDGNDDSFKQDAAERSEQATSEFVHLLTAHQHRIRAYLIAMVFSEHLADDILQETNMALWKKRSAYDHNRPFFPWACGIAFVEVMRSRRKMATDKLRFDVALLESVSDEFNRQGDLLDDRRDALRNCLARLSSKDRRLIEIRYGDGGSMDEMTSQFERSPKTIYKALARIREVLYRCIERSIAQSQHPRLGS